MTLFFAAVLVSAGLIFLVEPMAAKMLLPALGGTPAVWNTCMVFFQAGLLAGYGYAHLGPRWLGVRPQAALHVALLVVAGLTLPLAFPEPHGDESYPIAWLLMTLLLRLGPTFALLSASAPLLQRWYAAAGRGDPYVLYAASNLGSFAALMLYPFAVEPLLPLADQTRWWLYGYVGLVVLMAGCAATVWYRSAPATGPLEPLVTDGPPAWATRGRWVLLALVPSSLMLSVTTYLTTDVAPIPLLWVVPLGLYLLTFTIAFAGRPLIPQAVLQRWLPLVGLVLALLLLMEASDPLPLVMGLHLLGLFWIALACHGELAARRPGTRHLTEYYLWLAVGGVLGGVFNALLAPLIFPGLVEYPLMIVAACLLVLPQDRPGRADIVRGVALVGGVALALAVMSRLLTADWTSSAAVVFAVPLVLAYLWHWQPWTFGLGLGCIFLAGTLHPGVHGGTLDRERSYFGVHRVTQAEGIRRLVHGHTTHGEQALADLRTPRTYYHPDGPIGELFAALKDDPRADRVGLVGLGAGSLAAYGGPGQHFTYYEIDPTVVRIAERHFTFLPDARRRGATVDTVVGDARLRLARSPDKVGVLVVDAFGSDAIPLHLLTREALDVYLDRLTDHGLLAFHISNRYVDLEPVLANLARERNLVCYLREDRAVSRDAQRGGRLPSVWAMLARRSADVPLLGGPTAWRPARPRPDLPVWTDDYSNLFRVFRWRETDDP